MNDTITCLVRGPGSRYPRGFIWHIPVWFAILGAAVVAAGARASGKMPLWLGIYEIGGLALAACTMFAVMVTMRRHAFRANSHGIWLGITTTRKRPKLRQIYLAWPDIDQVRLVPRRYGALVEITLGPAARIVHRPGLGKQSLMWLGSLILPLGFGRGRPALTVPRLDPPRYRVKVCGHSATDMKIALASVMPEAPSVRMLPRKAALRYAVPSARRPPTQRPASPVG